MKLWWLTDLARVRKERAAIEALPTEGWFHFGTWLLDGERLSVRGDIEAHGVRYPVRLLYPDQFPSVPAWVQPISEEEKWTIHQYGKGGVLCLELRPDNWSPEATGADVLRSAFNLLRTENPSGDGPRERVPSAHSIGEIQAYSWGDEPLIAYADCYERILAGKAADIRGLSWLADENLWPILIADAEDRSRRSLPAADLSAWRLTVPIFVAQSEAPAAVPDDRKSLQASLGGVEIPDSITSAVLVLAVGKEVVVPYYSPNASSVKRRKWVIFRDQPGQRSGRSEVAKTKSVAIVGLGSVGSKIAETLARAGVGRMVLVDGDIVVPGNLERHTLDWRDVGLYKVERIKLRLKQIVPNFVAETIPVNLDWQRSARLHATQIDKIASCSVIVNATGDIPTALLLGAIAAENEIPFVSSEVFEGGIGALIGRSIPGRDPSYVRGRGAYNAYCEIRNVQPPVSGYARYDAVDDGGEPIVADDAAVAIAAGHAARTILDILDERVGENDTGWLLLGFRKAWLFQRHGDNIALDVGTPEKKATQGADTEMFEFVSALVREATGASANSD